MWHFTVSISRRAVVGALLLGVVIAFSSLRIVRAELDRITHDNQVYKCSSGSACVEGEASGKNVIGVRGTSSAGTGVQGNSTATNKNSGVAGVNSATTGTGYGVYGRSSNGPGIYATSSKGPGLYAASTNGPGISATSSTGDGIDATSTSPYATVGGNFTGNDGVGASAAFGSAFFGGSSSNATYKGEGVPVIGGVSYSAQGWIFAGENYHNSTQCQIDEEANLGCSGSIQGGSNIAVRHKTSEGRHVLAYASESASQTIEDVGTARMSDGIANVRIDPGFVSVTDHRWYYVFLTPLGDTRGLYVSIKTASGFQVRENARGRSNVEFDYRIVAHPFDSKYDRLPDAPLQKRMRIPAVIKN